MNIKVKEQSTIELSKEIKQNAFFYHTHEWQEFIQSSFDIEQLWITASNESNIILTALPITKIKSRIFGKRIIATGYQEYGGLIGDKAHLKKILEFVKEKYQDEFEYLEIKGAINEHNNPKDSNLLHKEPRYKRFTLKLTTKEEVWKTIQKSKRKAINKAKKECVCRELRAKDIDAFYRLYLQNMRRFGSPPYSKKYFHNFLISVQSKGHGKIYGCFKDHKLISALLGFTYNKTVHITTAISNPKYAKYRPSDLMHWKFIKWAQENNYQSFDFGLVREESGQFEYKRKWGAELKELPSYFLLLNAKKVPKPLDPSNKKYKLAIKLWQHLPLKITEWVGMRLREDLGI